MKKVCEDGHDSKGLSTKQRYYKLFMARLTDVDTNNCYMCKVAHYVISGGSNHERLTNV